MSAMCKHMMFLRYLLTICLMGTFLILPRLCFADAYDDARSLANNFMLKSNGMWALTKTETEALVKTLCNADAEESDFDSVANNAGKRARDNVQKEYDTLKVENDQTIAALDKIIADPTLSSHHQAARSLKDRIEELWGRIEKLTNAIRGGDHPVVSYIREAGQEAPQAYYDRHRTFCTVGGGYAVGDFKADCISADQCWVMEVKPKDALDKGREQAQQIATILNTTPAEFEKLMAANQRFKKCEGKFAPKLAPYSFCPKIDAEGKYDVDTRYNWEEPID